MSNLQPQGGGAGPAGGAMNVPQQQNAGAPQGQGSSQQNLNQIVIEYLTKKGYSQTRQVLEAESTYVDSSGRSPSDRPDILGNSRFMNAFNLLNGWIETNLDIYKFELGRLLWPVYVYSYLEMVEKLTPADAKEYLNKYKWHFERVHADELRVLDTVTLKQHTRENSVARLYLDNKYRLPLNTHVYFNLITFLEQNGRAGGDTIIKILQSHCEVKQTERGPIDQFSFEAIITRARGSDPAELGDMEEGIPGGFTGVSNHDILNNNAPIRLGPQQTELELSQDVRAELQDEDLRNPPEPGQTTLVEAYDLKIKREESVDAIPRNEIPYPPSRARDVVMEVQKIKENRDRFKIEGRTGGVGPAVSVCMFTFHNTMDAITCVEFSDDNNLAAVGTEESYIRVWHLHGEALTSTIPAATPDAKPSSSRRLIGHSAPVYSVSFSPSTSAPENANNSTPSTAPKLLLSSSSDKTVRLWSLETWSCLVVYKGHEGPVWNVRWGPFGHYFATCGWDKTVRVWTQDQISYLRLMVGHDTSVNQIAWHPNGAYLFSTSDEADKTVRMWTVSTGQCVRVFTGHTEFISAVECSPNGKILASADGGGSIILWDLTKGTQIKRCRGHGRGGIWSLAFSAESTVLTSGGADGTVRVWDINVPADPYKGGDGENVIGTGGQVDATRLTGAGAGTAVGAVGAGGVAGGVAAGGSGVVGGGKKKGKDVVITPDQISAFPTKKSPVYKVKFTRMNLVMGGGCYLP